LGEGTLTFRILGKKDPSTTVKIVSSKAETWDSPVKTVQDSRLAAGKRKVVEKGARGHSVNMFRVVYKDGVEVARQPLGRSYYRGSARVVAIGTKLVTPIGPKAPTAGTAADTTQTTRTTATLPRSAHTD
jgi:uncharacterized protein YabE (DUF348 family)